LSPKLLGIFLAKRNLINIEGSSPALFSLTPEPGLMGFLWVKPLSLDTPLLKQSTSAWKIPSGIILAKHGLLKQLPYLFRIGWWDHVCQKHLQLTVDRYP